MQDTFALTTTANPAAGAATVRVLGEFGPAGHAPLRNGELWVAANCPRRLVRVMAARPEAERRCE